MINVWKCLVAFIFALTLFTSAGLRAAEPIVILAPFNLTGPESVLDKPSYDGAVIAAEKLNAKGGVLGRPIKLIPLDTKGETDPAANGVETLIASHPDAVAGIGFTYSTDALSAGRVFQKAGLPFVSPGATAPDLPGKVGAYMFLAAYGDDAQARVMAIYAKDVLKARHVALWIDDSRVYTRTIGKFFNEFLVKMGGSIDRHTFSGPVSDFSSLIAAFQKADPAPEAIYAAVMPQSGVPLIQQVRDAGITVPLLSGDGWDDEQIVSLSKQDAIRDLYFTTHRFLGVKTPQMDAFVTAYKKRFGSAPSNAFAPLGFDAINLLASAIERAGSTKPDAIRTALADTRDFAGVVGKISYAPGKRVPEKSVAVIHLEEGTETPVWTWPPSP